MRVYKYYDAKYGRMALNESRLKLATIKDLNDPFEFRSPAFRTSHDRKMFKNTIEKCMSRKGVLCFSKSRRNPVMWSHYANSHKGICLGFDVDDQCLSPIIYAGRRPRNEFRYDDISCSENEQIFEKCLLTKFSHWKYEKEMRALMKKSSYKELRFVVNSKGKMWAWDTNDALHDAVIFAMTGEKYDGDYAKGMIVFFNPDDLDDYMAVPDGGLHIILHNSILAAAKFVFKNKTMKALAKRINAKGKDRVWWADT